MRFMTLRIKSQKNRQLGRHQQGCYKPSEDPVERPPKPACWLTPLADAYRSRRAVSSSGKK